MATHSSILSWEIPWTEEPDGLQSMESQRVRHDLATERADTHKKYDNDRDPETCREMKPKITAARIPQCWDDGICTSLSLPFPFGKHLDHSPLEETRDPLCQI